jgi:hypothetical protein
MEGQGWWQGNRTEACGRWEMTAWTRMLEVEVGISLELTSLSHRLMCRGFCSTGGVLFLQLFPKSNVLPRLALNYIPILASYIAGIIGMHYHSWFYCAFERCLTT